MNSENFMYLCLTLLFGLTIAILHKFTYLLTTGLVCINRRLVKFTGA